MTFSWFKSKGFSLLSNGQLLGKLTKVLKVSHLQLIVTVLLPIYQVIEFFDYAVKIGSRLGINLTKFLKR